MNVNLWNIKDLFSTPTKMGPNKPPSWTSAPSDYNSMSDSQFLLGSQFCPENSQPGSLPLEFCNQQRQDRNSQQNSQDNESSIFAKYQSKPQLFGGDGKDKGSLNFPAGRYKGVLEQFEENKRKIKEKHDNELLNTFILNTKESLQRLESSFAMFEDTLKSVLSALESHSKTMQETSQSHYESVQNALKERNEMEQALLEMEKNLHRKDIEISDLKANLQSLKESLEQLTTQQKEQHLNLCEQIGLMQIPRLLTELQAFISSPRAPTQIKDNASQTSPNMMLTQQPHDCHGNISKTSPGNKVVSMIASPQSKKNLDMQQQSGHIAARGQDANNSIYISCSTAAVPSSSPEGCWPFTQDLYQATPIRKVLKRDNRGKRLTLRRPLQQNQTRISNTLLQNHAEEHKNRVLSTNGNMPNKGRGRGVRKKKSKMWGHKKSLYSSKKERNYLMYINADVKQNINGRGCSNLEKTQYSFNPGSSSLAPSPAVLQSQENVQCAASVQGIPGVQNRMGLSSTKNNRFFWANSSPDSCLSPKWFHLFENNSPSSSQKESKKYCPIFFDSEYSD
ncbi:interactor of HORMAD1 protein 1 isoform X1 [Anolis carolinensis]|uniref:interactor of HORMAD1 protein 1 isoform X1 n=2 Tax=Anolis carolinensis TaxID=28377 RepID=UPI002F2B3500